MYYKIHFVDERSASECVVVKSICAVLLVATGYTSECRRYRRNCAYITYAKPADCRRVSVYFSSGNSFPRTAFFYLCDRQLLFVRVVLLLLFVNFIR